MLIVSSLKSFPLRTGLANLNVLTSALVFKSKTSILCRRLHSDCYLSNYLKRNPFANQVSKSVVRTMASQNSPNSWKELRFPVPWGHIAAKEYGDPNGIPVLAIHGWLDNCGSFDPILPYILQPHNLHVVSMDEPGCGFSSHKPPGSDYGRWSTVKEMKRVIDHMGWKKCTLLGHSQGGHYSFIFASIYPEIVERLISVDVAKPVTYSFNMWVDKAQFIIDKHMKYDEKFLNDPTLESTVPIYPEAEALQKIMDSHANSLTEETARILMIRGAKPFKTGVVFTRDIRLRLPPMEPSVTDETMMKLLAKMRSDLLIIRAKHGPYPAPEKLRLQYYELYNRHCRMFRDVELDGSHHLHMNDPKMVAQVINQFITESLELNISSFDSKL